MRAYEFEKPLTIQQTQDKALKQQANRIKIKQKLLRLQKQRERAAATATQIKTLKSRES